MKFEQHESGQLEKDFPTTVIDKEGLHFIKMFVFVRWKQNVNELSAQYLTVVIKRHTFESLQSDNFIGYFDTILRKG